MAEKKESRFFTWGFPVLLAVLPGLVVWGQYEVMRVMQEAADLRGEWAKNGWVILVAFCLLVFLFCCGVGWLVITVVRSARQRRWWGVVGRCAVGLITYGIWSACALVCLLLWAGRGPDTFAMELALPADCEFVCPRHMDGADVDADDARAGRVRELCALRPQLPEPQPREGEVAALELPHTQKLASEAPELLQEYALRCLYAEAVNPRFSSAVLYRYQHARLWHADSPDAQRVAEPEDSQQCIVLGNGWKWGFAEAVDAQADAARLEAELAPLAQNPVPEQLDAMVPASPAGPFLSLWKDYTYDHEGELCYGALLVIPTAYPAGKWTLKAYEYTECKPLRFNNVMTECASPGAYAWDMRVYTGRVGQYYGSVWEIWFHPAAGGEPRCVATQEFLMMGN